MKSKSTTKKRLNIGLSLVLVAVLVIGVTLAYLSTRTNDEVNNFSVLGGLDVDLKENWNEEDGEDMSPGDEAKKEPYMVNNSTTKEVYVAMQLYLVKGNYSDIDAVPASSILSDAQYQELLTMIEITYDGSSGINPDINSKWIEIDGDTATKNGTIFMYEDVLDVTGSGDNETDYLFKSVKLKDGLTTAQQEWIGDTLGGFSIVLRGAAIQADDGQGGYIDRDTVAASELAGEFKADPIQ